MTSIRGMDGAFILRSKSKKKKTSGYHKAVVNTSSQEAKGWSFLGWTTEHRRLTRLMNVPLSRNRSAQSALACIFLMKLAPAANLSNWRVSQGYGKACKTTELHKDYWLFHVSLNGLLSENSDISLLWSMMTDGLVHVTMLSKEHVSLNFWIWMCLWQLVSVLLFKLL